MKHDQKTFGRRVAAISCAQRDARRVMIWTGGAGLIFAVVAFGAGVADKPGAVMVAFLAATFSIMVAIAAATEA